MSEAVRGADPSMSGCQVLVKYYDGPGGSQSSFNFHSPVLIFHSPVLIFHSLVLIFHSPVLIFHSPVLTFYSPVLTFYSPVLIFAHFSFNFCTVQF